MAIKIGVNLSGFNYKSSTKKQRDRKRSTKIINLNI